MNKFRAAASCYAAVSAAFASIHLPCVSRRGRPVPNASLPVRCDAASQLPFRDRLCPPGRMIPQNWFGRFALRTPREASRVRRAGEGSLPHLQSTDYLPGLITTSEGGMVIDLVEPGEGGGFRYVKRGCSLMIPPGVPRQHLTRDPGCRRSESPTGSPGPFVVTILSGRPQLRARSGWSVLRVFLFSAKRRGFPALEIPRFLRPFCHREKDHSKPENPLDRGGSGE